ncbi:MAG: prepilin-type N-terminal cleavage/methylation domain-containing protein [Gammaproteobacteria bacterium]|nr:prepilin-type N-terminal cleavage/methylation domain-containing protein [Gammaproteobacteria bacterium]
MLKQQSGFTLIELIMVIVVLGALAVTALPRYINLQGQAEQGATDGVAGALAAGSAINFADCTAGGGATCLTGGAMANCTDVAATLLGGLPATHAITALALGASGTTTVCTVTGAGASSATFTALTP